MKHKSVYLLCFLILPILLLTSVSAYAVSNPVGEPSHAVKPKIEKYDLSHYRSIYSEKRRLESVWSRRNFTTN
ncbi:putative mating channel protein [Staphylococcus aureus]|uniref:Putative mating channel protein n=1 Tax=Staphylococcus aureus TaxID=1280 RepID=A0A8G2I1Y3_STAAU|nr:putative mating channel protein [Staphylococcus aureus]